MRIRRAMSESDRDALLTGIVEMDETYVAEVKDQETYDSTKAGRGTNKVPVLGAVERSGRVKAQVKGKYDLKKIDMEEFVHEYISTPTTTLMTDGYGAYRGMGRFITHKVIAHWASFSDGDAHTNTIESFWAIVKRGMFGQFHHVSLKHLQRYIDEFCYRYNLRNSTPAHAFEFTIQNALATSL